MCDEAFWQPFTSRVPDFLPALRCQVVDYGEVDSITDMALVVLADAPPLFALAGHSMGGRVAMEVMRLAPLRVQKLILMDTGFLPRAAGDAGEAEQAGRMALVELARTEGVRAMCVQWVKAMVHPERLNDVDLIESILAMFTRKNAERFARQQNALLTRPDASPVLAGLTLPTLLLCGRQDNWASVAQHEAMQTLAGHASLCVIEDAGHMVLMEQPESTVQVIKQFLQ